MSRLIIAAAAVAVLGLGGWYLSTPSGDSSSTNLELSDPLVGAANAQDSDVDISSIEEMRLGNPDAPVTVIEYASYTCPHCASFHAGTFKELKESIDNECVDLQDFANSGDPDLIALGEAAGKSEDHRTLFGFYQHIARRAIASRGIADRRFDGVGDKI